MSLIEVSCPHCGAKGRIMMPPLGSIIFGPCPECGEMVLIFCGQTLPLDKAVMVDGNEEEKKEHLLEAIGLYLQDRVDRLFEEGLDQDPIDPMVKEAVDKGCPSEQCEEGAAQEAEKATISEAEFNAFRNVELRLLDNKDYFRSVFE
jgi:hypothetical protein